MFKRIALIAAISLAGVQPAMAHDGQNGAALGGFAAGLITGAIINGAAQPAPPPYAYQYPRGPARGKWVCYAGDRYRQSYAASGPTPDIALDRAVGKCQAVSIGCRPMMDDCQTL
jgi:hypothetical protein